MLKGLFDHLNVNIRCTCMHRFELFYGDFSLFDLYKAGVIKVRPDGQMQLTNFVGPQASCRVVRDYIIIPNYKNKERKK